jgi:hypothetical protein
MIHNSLTKVIRFCLTNGYYIKNVDQRITMFDCSNAPAFLLTINQLKYLITDVPLEEHAFPSYTIFTLPSKEIIGSLP